MKVILHIGTEKTGTSSIQDFLHQKRSQLAEQGFYYLHMLDRCDYRDFPAYCMNFGRSDEYFKRAFVRTKHEREAFNQQFLNQFHQVCRHIPSHIHTVIISSEHFASRLKFNEELERLNALLLEYFEQVEVVCYLRNQADKIKSSYSTKIKTGATITFIEHLEKAAKSKFNYYDNLLELWEREFGKENIRLRLFDQKSFYDNQLLRDFIHEINPDLLAYLDTNVETKNESLSSIGVLLARWVNILIPVFNPKKGVNKLNRVLVKGIGRCVAGSKIRMTEVQRAEIMMRYKNSNERIREKYFPERDRLF